MARTTATLVKKVLLDDYGTLRSRVEPDLDVFIETASAIVDDVAACAEGKGLTFGAARAELLERWLAAHGFVMSLQNYAEKQTERAKAKYQGKTGMYLEASKYGQMAVTLDSTGCLAEVASSVKTVGVIWLGKQESEQIDYNDRNGV